MDLGSFVQVDAADESSLGLCYKAPARAYIQYQCYLTDDMLDANERVLTIDITFAICAGVFFTACFYLHNFQQKKYQDQIAEDLVTAHNYSVEFQLTPHFTNEVEDILKST